MSIQAKERDIRNLGRVFRVGYCDAQHILTGESAIAYTAGVYGWNGSLYAIRDDAGRVAYIHTGYRRLIGADVNRATLEAFEAAAAAAHDRSALEKIRRAFAAALIDGRACCTIIEEAAAAD